MGLDWGSLSPGQYFSGKSMPLTQWNICGQFAPPRDCNKTRHEYKTFRLRVNVSRDQLAEKQAIDYTIGTIAYSL